METFIPQEIWTNILSYNSLPVLRSVCSMLDIVERDLKEERILNILNRYGGFLDCAMEHDWDASLFIIENRDDNRLDCVSGSKYFLSTIIKKDRKDIADVLFDDYDYTTCFGIMVEAIRSSDVDTLQFLLDRNWVSDSSLCKYLSYMFTPKLNTNVLDMILLHNRDNISHICIYGLSSNNRYLLSLLVEKYGVYWTSLLSIAQIQKSDDDLIRYITKKCESGSGSCSIM